jgi:hypothetical protein
LTRVEPHEWSPHYNANDYGGQWRGAALRSANGSVRDLRAQAFDFAGTPLLDRCPYFREVLAAFHCPLKSVRLLALAPGSFIREHTDNALEYAGGEVRIHIPVQTSSDVEFYVAGERLLLEEGGCYYVNVNLPHRVNNCGTTERIHLVIDANVDEWIHNLFRQAGRIPRCAAPRGFADFRDRLVQSPRLSGQLHSIHDRDQFLARAVELGRELGFRFTPADVEASVRPADPASSMESLQGWTPIRIFFRGSEALAEWIWTGSRRFTESFFEDTIKEALRSPFTSLIRREMPLDAADRIEGLAPAGLIFHMSRCGSDRIARMLAALDRAVVISEAGPVDAILQAKLSLPGLPKQHHIRWLRQVVASLGQRRSGAESLYFLNLHAWHIHHLPLLREAFPDVPWIFAHRDPREVIASYLREPGRLSLPGAVDPRFLRLRPEDITAFTREDWCKRVVHGFLESADSGRGDPLGLFVDYATLPEAVWGSIAAHFGVQLTAEEQERMRTES